MPPKWKPFYYYHKRRWHFVATHNDWLNIDSDLKNVILKYQKHGKEHHGHDAFGHSSTTFFGIPLAKWIEE